MKIFITGATGFVGTQLVQLLRDTPHELCCLVRDPNKAEAAREAGAKIVVGDLTDKASLVEGMRGCDWVASVANLYEFWVPDRRAYIRVNVDGVRDLMEAALEAGVAKVVHVSTAAVWGNAKGPVTEQTPFGPKYIGGYIGSKRRGEEVAWNLHQTRGLPLVMVYPGAIVGPNDPKAAGQYVRNYLQGAMPARVLTNSIFPWVHVRDVAAGVVKALEKDGNVGERYLLVAESLTFGQINELLTEISGVQPPRLAFPDWLTVIGAACATGVANLIKKPPMLGMALDQIQLMKQGLAVDGSKATRELGLRYIPIRTALEEAVATSGVAAKSAS
jgi:dihydroflavonol-4-reductase